MKLKTFTIQNGAIVEVGPFSHGLTRPEVQAKTKGEATALMLAEFAAMANADRPRLWVKNSGYCLVYHDGKGYSSEAGTIHPARQNSDGSACSLTFAGTYDSAKTALKNSSFDYYSTEDFAREQANAYAQT
jgi:hypothetical protein